MIIEQGDILRIEHIQMPVLIVSKNFFNQNGQVICCPIINNNYQADALHISVKNNEVKGVVLCEQLKFIDLRVRGYKKIGFLDLSDIIEITDAIQSIFDYFSYQ